MSERRKAILRWAAVAGLAVAILVVSSIPGEYLQVGAWFSWQDKVVHAAMYFALAFLFARAMNVPRRNAWLVGGVTFAAVAAFGAVEEVHQALVPERCATVGDVLANGIGAGAAGLLWPAIQLKWP